MRNEKRRILNEHFDAGEGKRSGPHSISRTVIPHPSCQLASAVGGEGRAGPSAVSILAPELLDAAGPVETAVERESLPSPDGSSKSTSRASRKRRSQLEVLLSSDGSVGVDDPHSPSPVSTRLRSRIGGAGQEPCGSEPCGTESCGSYPATATTATTTTTVTTASSNNSSNNSSSDNNSCNNSPNNNSPNNNSPNNNSSSHNSPNNNSSSHNSPNDSSSGSNSGSNNNSTNSNRTSTTNNNNESIPPESNCYVMDDSNGNHLTSPPPPHCLDGMDATDGELEKRKRFGSDILLALADKISGRKKGGKKAVLHSSDLGFLNQLNSSLLINQTNPGLNNGLKKVRSRLNPHKRKRAGPPEQRKRLKLEHTIKQEEASPTCKTKKEPSASRPSSALSNGYRPPSATEFKSTKHTATKWSNGWSWQGSFPIPSEADGDSMLSQLIIVWVNHCLN